MTEYIIPTIVCALCITAGYFFAWLTYRRTIKDLNEAHNYWMKHANEVTQEIEKLISQRGGLISRARRGAYLPWKGYLAHPAIGQEVLMYSSKPGGGFRVVEFDGTQKMIDEMEEFNVVWIGVYDLIEGKDMEPNSLWLAVYECRDEVLRISQDGLGFYAPGQDACWSLDEAQFIRKIKPSGER